MCELGGEAGDKIDPSALVIRWLSTGVHNIGDHKKYMANTLWKIVLYYDDGWIWQRVDEANLNAKNRRDLNAEFERQKSNAKLDASPPSSPPRSPRE